MPVPNIFAAQSGNVSASEIDANFAACLLVGGHAATSLVGNPTGGSGNAVDLSASQAYAILKTAIPWEVAAFMGGLQGGASWYILRYQPSTNLILVTGSSYSSAGTAATGATTFTITDNGSAIGTVAFAASGTVGTVSITGSPRAFTAGHVLAIQGPVSPDASLADVNFTLGGNRN